MQPPAARLAARRADSCPQGPRTTLPHPATCSDAEHTLIHLKKSCELGLGDESRQARSTCALLDCGERIPVEVVIEERD